MDGFQGKRKGVEMFLLIVHASINCRFFEYRDRDISEYKKSC